MYFNIDSRVKGFVCGAPIQASMISTGHCGPLFDALPPPHAPFPPFFSPISALVSSSVIQAPLMDGERDMGQELASTLMATVMKASGR